MTEWLLPCKLEPETLLLRPLVSASARRKKLKERYSQSKENIICEFKVSGSYHESFGD